MARMEPWCPSAIERAMERPMPKPLPFLCASALALSLTACAGTINNRTADTASNVTFTFTDSGVTAAGETDTGYEIDGTALTITSSGTYTVSGSCADGSIKVKKSTTGVTLVLDGLTLTSENTAAITCGKSSEVTILVSDGTENSLSDTEQNNDDNYPENENAENAVIKCKDGSLVTICGDGELTITANGTIDAYSSAGDGFDSNGDLTITGDTVIVWTANTADNEPLDADGTITVSGGTVLAAGDSSGVGMGGGFPGGGQKPDGEPPESFDGQMPNGEKSELPDGEVPEMPSGECPTPPSGQGSPADGNAPAGDSTSDTAPTA